MKAALVASLAVGAILGALVLWPQVRAPQPPSIVHRTVGASSVTLLFAGDTGQVDAALPTLEAKGLDYAFAKTAHWIAAADFAVTNLEAPITELGMPLFKRYRYRAPLASAAALQRAGFDAVSLANNHLRDFGDPGVVQTLATLAHEGVLSFGGGRDDIQARRGLVVDFGSARVGFLSYCEDQAQWHFYERIFATARRSGVARLSEAALAADLAQLRKDADIVVVNLHIGENYAPPTPAAISWSRRAVELGADLVVNHHPHVGHPVLVHQGKPILLSLGNYAFGTPGRPDLNDGWLAWAELVGKRLAAVTLRPLDVQNQRVQFQPRPLEGARLGEALARMQRQSQALGTTLANENGALVWRAP